MISEVVGKPVLQFDKLFMTHQLTCIFYAHDQHIVRAAIKMTESPPEFKQRHIPKMRQKRSDTCRESHGDEGLFRPPAVSLEGQAPGFVANFVLVDFQKMPPGIGVYSDAYSITFSRSLRFPPARRVRFIVRI